MQIDMIVTGMRGDMMTEITRDVHVDSSLENKFNVSNILA